MSEQAFEQLRAMKLYGFVEALQEQLHTPSYGELPFMKRLEFLIERESLRRHNASLCRRLKTAALQRNASIEDFCFTTPRGISKERLLTLAQCAWLEQQQNVIISGPTGAGKSFLASALGNKACRQGFHVKMVKTHLFADELLSARLQGILPKVIKSYQKFHLIIFDEWLRDILSLAQSREVLDFIDIRYGNRSHIFVGQLPSNQWHTKFEDPTIADAVLDRTTHIAHRITLSGESMRKVLHSVSS